MLIKPLWHHLFYLGLLYNHNILTRDKTKTISKVYYKQQEEDSKGDWFQALNFFLFFFSQGGHEQGNISHTAENVNTKINVWIS